MAPTPAFLNASMATDPFAVRQAISLTGQFASVDEDLTGRENLILLGRLLGLKRAGAKERAAELLEAFSLTEKRHDRTRTLSGGMKRRLILARALLEAGGADAAQAWNFGPDEADAQPVEWIVRHLCEKTPGGQWQLEQAVQPHEANILRLDSSKAKKELGWRPRWRIGEALEKTLAWHQAWRSGADMAQVSLRQIEDYEAA
jgi:ABC-type arginine transport system ATPase subunit